MSAERYRDYAKRMMRSGPYFDHHDQTLRIPHRWGHRRAKAEWQNRKMRHDAKRFEFYCRIPKDCAGDQVAKARRVFFCLYAAEFPEEYFRFVQNKEKEQ